MKLPKIDKIKKPSGLKMPGGLNTPVKRFTIKNRFLQKNLISLIVIAVLAIGTGTAYGTLSSRDADMGNDPVNGVNKDRFQVLVSGNGYKLSKNQEKNYKLQKKQNQVNAAKAAQAAQNNPNTIRTSNGNRVFRTSAGNFRYKPRTTTFKTSKVPRIQTNISDQIGMLDKKVGEKFKIRVAAYAYPYGTQNIISSDNIKVAFSSGSGKIELDKETKTGCIYEIELGEGAGKKKIVAITVTATDKKLKKTAKIGPFPIIGVEGDDNTSSTNPGSGDSGSGDSGSGDSGSGDSGSGDTPPATIKISANYGSVDGYSTEIDDNTTVEDVLKKAGVTVEGGEVTKVPGNFSSAIEALSDSKLEAEYREENSLSDEEEINQDDYNNWKNNLKDKEVKKGSPFSSTHWSCEPSVESKAKGVSTIELTLHLLD